MKTTTTEAQLYVGTYAKYNNSSIFGKWVKLSDFSNADEFLEHCAEIHKDEEDPEFMFQDSEGFPDSFYSEAMSSDDLQRLYDFLDLDDDDRQLVEMYAEATGADISADILRDAQEAFHGTADSGADFAERVAEDCGEIPRDLPSWICIDWESSWECNLTHDYSTATADDGTMYFFQC